MKEQKLTLWSELLSNVQQISFNHIWSIMFPSSCVILLLLSPIVLALCLYCALCFYGSMILNSECMHHWQSLKCFYSTIFLATHLFMWIIFSMALSSLKRRHNLWLNNYAIKIDVDLWRKTMLLTSLRHFSHTNENI